MSFLRATVLVGFVGPLEGTTFLERDSYKPYICRCYWEEGTLPRTRKNPQWTDPFTLRTPRKGGASIGTLTLVDLAGTEKDVTYCTGGVVELHMLHAFGKFFFSKRDGLFWEKG